MIAGVPLALWFRYARRVSVFALSFLIYATNAQAQTAPYRMDSSTYVAPSGLTTQAVGTESATYDSNPLLLTTGTQTLWGSMTSPELILSDKTPTATVTSDTIFTSNNFNQSDFDSNDLHSKLTLSKQRERWGAGLQGNVDYDTTRTSELSAYNNVSPLPVRHLGESLTPQISYSFLPTDKLDLTGTYSESNYASTAFTNYSTLSAHPSYTHNFDPQNAGTFSFKAQRYTALNNATNVTDTAGPSMGWQTILSERLNAMVSVGFQETREKTITTPNPSWTTQYNYSGSLTYRGDQDSLVANASRSQYPFGNGTEALMTQFSLNETHALNPLFAVSVFAGYQSATYPTSANGNLLSLLTGSGNFIYHATDHVDVTATYEYQKETLIGVSANAHKNVSLLSLTYHPMAWIP